MLWGDFVVLCFLRIFATVKQLIQHRKHISYLLVVLMIMAFSSRLYLTHDRDYYEDILRTEQSSHDNGAGVSCNCPICHAEDYIAIKAEYFEYHPIITTIDYEFAVKPTATANRIVVTTALRGPPCLS
jgi:hypothetical protein